MIEKIDQTNRLVNKFSSCERKNKINDKRPIDEIKYTVVGGSSLVNDNKR